MVPVKGILTLCGGVLIHLTLGTLYSFGNINPYLTSYLRKHTPNKSLDYSDSMWIFAVTVMGQGLFMTLGGILDTKLGHRLTALIGGLTMSCGVLMTRFTVEKSFPATIFTYGFLFGVGIGIAYSVPLKCAMEWFPGHKGLVNGIIVAGFGAGALIFDQVQTVYINVDNLKPNLTVGPNDEKYFDQPSLLNRVPNVFILLGCVYASMQIIGAFLLMIPDTCHAKISQESDLLIQDPDNPDKYSPVQMNYDKHPLSVIKTREFWTLWFMFLVNGQAVMFISTMYKAYGETFISDDYLLAAIGSCAAVFNGVARILWGHLADRRGFRLAMMIQCCLMAFLLFTFVLTEKAGSWMYFIWVCLLFGTLAGNFALFPTVTAKSFGEEYFTINYGMVFTSQIIAGAVGTLLSQSLANHIGWIGLFCLAGGFSLVGLLLAVSFDVKNPNGQDI